MTRSSRGNRSRRRVETGAEIGYNPPMQLRVAAIVLGLGFWPTVALASPVNMERIATDDKKGWSATADLSGGVKQGNVDKREVNFGGGVQYRTFHPVEDTRRPPFMKDRWLLSSNLSLVTFNGAPISDNGFMHVRYTRMVVPRAGPEVFIQSQYNAFTNLRARMLTGAGGRFVAVHRNEFGLWGGSGYMLEYELNTIASPDPHPRETFNHRWTSYVSMQIDVLEDQLKLGSTTYVQPRFDDFRDIRILTGFQLEGSIVPMFSLGMDLQVAYDSRPPRTVKNTDISFTGFARFRFG